MEKNAEKRKDSHQGPRGWAKAPKLHKAKEGTESKPHEDSRAA